MIAAQEVHEGGRVPRRRLGRSSSAPRAPLISRSSGFDEQEPALVLGERIDGTPYRVIRCVGHGGMGDVYEVEHVGLGQRRALKVLRRSHRQRPDLAERLRREARALARVEHDNLVRVFDVGETTSGRPYLAMELLVGRDLREQLSREGALPVARALGLITQALDGLSALHARGLVHRDVKLENLFLCDDGTLKVVDLGVAKAPAPDEGMTQPGVALGTPRTMAPEQRASGPIDARADLYAVGLALYELVAGRGPFDEYRERPEALRFAHGERPPPPPSRFATQPIPAAVEAAILRALAKSPDARYADAADMASALRMISARRCTEPPELAGAVVMADPLPAPSTAELYGDAGELDATMPDLRPTPARSTPDPWARRVVPYEPVAVGRVHEARERVTPYEARRPVRSGAIASPRRERIGTVSAIVALAAGSFLLGLVAGRALPAAASSPHRPQAIASWR